ncbi:MAG: type II toxin-antitoxin system VapC family toxin [Phormidesmis sp. CAN_BIN44]|nr:type II toxin-antitoxin system VapC family toxin [Phormidesmis sp. CAN_BIN44]
MTSYVVDTSIVVQRFIVDRFTPQVKILFSQLQTGTDLVIPEFCLLECTNVFWKQVRFQGMPVSAAEYLINDLLAVPFQIEPATGSLQQALHIGTEHQLAVYDSVFIALAQQLDVPLISVDERQVRAAIAQNVTIKPISEFS